MNYFYKAWSSPNDDILLSSVCYPNRVNSILLSVYPIFLRSHPSAILLPSVSPQKAWYAAVTSYTAAPTSLAAKPESLRLAVTKESQVLYKVILVYTPNRCKVTTFEQLRT